MLTTDDIQFLLELVGEKTVVKPTKDFPYRISTRGFGYSDDAKIGRIQAALSIMLEAARREK